MSQNMDLTIGTHRESAFYELEFGPRTIMTLANFPDDVLPLLQMESLMTFEAMAYLRCDALVELGCYDGRALEIARLLNARYLGVDLDQRAIETLRTRIEREGMSDRADTVVDDILNHTRRGASVGSRKLPSRLNGSRYSAREPKRLLDSLAERSVAAVVSVFGDSAEATRVRQSYYRRCGVQGLELHTRDDGTVFTGSDGFYSRSYSRACLHALLAECGLTVVRSASNLFAHCVTVLPEGADQGFGSSAA
ncbi:SAM-dependent methyltransferase [Pseudomonas aeruginosa]|uniref:SAM-dependent methyltransferase n=1 Tax=Pseudomonas aeruginosa TaxID=287 RepID=UPI002237452E|nr:class I SAM-dependent methyltransferase [Pseudomonas aeruginosa]MCW5369694.1 class I SAM-dependent methyltransferase [Pseudomonas aeruginosa]